MLRYEGLQRDECGHFQVSIAYRYGPLYITEIMLWKKVVMKHLLCIHEGVIYFGGRIGNIRKKMPFILKLKL